MNLFGLFKSRWQRVGEDALGSWPLIYRHRKKGDIRVEVWHNAPDDYLRAMRRASLLVFVMVLGWGYLGYAAYCDLQKAGKCPEPIPATLAVAFALATLAVPHRLAKRKMKKHPATGRSVAEFRIAKGTLLVPSGEQSVIEQFHSATAGPHPRARQEAQEEELGQRRQQQSGSPITAGSKLYRESSCVQVRAGYRGARLLHTIEFCNDPEQKWAGLAAAAIDYALMLAKNGPPKPAATVRASVVMVGGRAIARET